MSVPAGEGEARGHRRRHAARRKAVDILYQADVTEREPALVVAEWRAAGRPVPAYAAQLVAGVQGSRERIDRLLGEAAEGWTVARMPPVDRAILRVACHELLAGVPAPVAINEAVEMANEVSTEDSGRFVNGVLGKIARDLEAPAGDAGA